ncbi:O157 family O-antigen flippase [soil metagenome]
MNPASSSPSLFTRLRGYVSLLRLRPFDTTTEGGRTNERHRRIVLSAAASFAAKAVQSICMLIYVPLALNYLGKERFGLWQTMTALIGSLAISDLGIGNGMISMLAATQGADDRPQARRIISSATFIILLVAAIAGMAFAIVYPLVDWPAVFNAQSPLATSESGPAVAWCIALFLVSLPLNVVQSTHLGYQEGFVPNIVQAAMNALGLLGIFIAIKLGYGLVGMTILWLGGSIIVRAINAIYLFGVQRRWLTPALRDFHWKTAISLLKVSVLFLVIGASIAVGYTSDSFVVTQILGPEAVTEYNVPYRLFSIVTVALGFFLGPLWPAYAEARSRGDVAWVKRTLRRSLFISFAFNLFAAAALMVAGRFLIHLWVKDAVSPSNALLFAFAMYLLVAGLHVPLSALLNGLSIVRFQLACWIAMAVVNIGLSIWLTKLYGVPGVVFGTVIANFVCFVVPSAWYVRRFLSRMQPAGTEP